MPELGTSSASLEHLSNLQRLEFTPWFWKRRDLHVFEHLPHLRHLMLKVDWLPNADSLSRCWANLNSLHLVRYDVNRLTALFKLKNLKHLVLSSLTINSQSAQCAHYRPVALLVHAMPWLHSLGLNDILHSSSVTFSGTNHSTEGIQAVTLASCKNCFRHLLSSLRCSTSPTVAFNGITLRLADLGLQCHASKGVTEFKEV